MPQIIAVDLPSDSVMMVTHYLVDRYANYDFWRFADGKWNYVYTKYDLRDEYLPSLYKKLTIGEYFTECVVGIKEATARLRKATGDSILLVALISDKGSVIGNRDASTSIRHLLE